MKQLKIPKIKKELKNFLTNQEGEINKKDVILIAVAVLAVAVAISGAIDINDVSAATCGHGQHSSY